MFLVQELDGSCVYIFRRFGGKKKTREEAEWREEQDGSPKGGVHGLDWASPIFFVIGPDFRLGLTTSPFTN